MTHKAEFKENPCNGTVSVAFFININDEKIVERLASQLLDIFLPFSSMLMDIVMDIQQ